MEGRRKTLLRILSQSIYIITAYGFIYSFSFNNRDVSFEKFLEHNLIQSKYITVSFSHIIGIIIVFFIARVLLNFVKLYITRNLKSRKDLDASAQFVYIQIAKYIIYIFAFVICLQILNVKLTVLLTGSAALLVGIGLGLQDVFKDIFSGFVLLFEGNVRIGDILEIYNTGDKEPVVAKIIKINVRTTQIETRNGNVLIIPNNKLTQEYVENWSHGSPLSRFIIEVSVAYGTDTELVKDLMKMAALGHPKVHKNLEVLVRMKNFGGNGLEMEVLFWAEQSWDVNTFKSDIRFEIDRLFREHKVTIPFPQRDVRVKSEG
ncbi:mechanosensitive ion channel [Crocinitomicaceae bacterium]|nr:mechanosensitive ion channel [Crocinitomicaceae bacterium]